MAYFDVFNGDADGILSLVQLRLAEPRSGAKLVTGCKRDIELLKNVEVGSNDSITVLDISMRNNIEPLKKILSTGAKVFYLDHHNAGDIPIHPNLTAVIDTSPEMCTAMLVNEALDGDYLPWAITAAFGDNFPSLARRKANGLDLPLDQLERLGMLINYNSYGASLEDLHFHPAELYELLVPYKTPMDFLAENLKIFNYLDKAYKNDFEETKSANVILDQEACYVLELPNTAGSRRISGFYGNHLAQSFPDRAHAILTHIPEGFVVSVRAPLSHRSGADTLCLKFKSGGGRSAAAGINHLPVSDVDYFIRAFQTQFAITS
jgi:hypothetical protein